MAESSWAKETVNGVIFHTTTVDSTDGSKMLAVQPKSHLVYTIQYGGADSIGVLASADMNPATANAVAVKSGIMADDNDIFVGAISGVKFTSDGANSHIIQVIEVLDHWSNR